MSALSLPPFDYIRPQNLEEALKHLQDYPNDTRILAGGTDLLPSMRYRLFNPQYILDIHHLHELQRIQIDDEYVRVGAAVSLRTLEHHPVISKDYPALAYVLASVAAPNIRNLATLGGNVCLDTRCHWYNQSYFWRKSLGFCLKKDGNRCHVAPSGKRCWAAYSGDGAAALLPLEAELFILSSHKSRQVPLETFFTGEGDQKFHLKPGELLKEILIPRRNAGFRAKYYKLRVRRSVDYPLAGVAVMVKESMGKAFDIRIGLTAVSPRPLSFRIDSEVYPAEERVTQITEQGGRLARPLSTTRLYSMDYRRYWVRSMIQKGLTELLGLPPVPSSDKVSPQPYVHLGGPSFPAAP